MRSEIEGVRTKDRTLQCFDIAGWVMERASDMNRCCNLPMVHLSQTI